MAGRMPTLAETTGSGELHSPILLAASGLETAAPCFRDSENQLAHLP
jgi:hypothetical protein